jgi:hypothetical protein
VAGADALKGNNMTPARFPFDDACIEHIPAVVVEACNKVELLGDIGRPAMIGRVVLDQLSRMAGDYFPVMDDPLLFREVKAVFFALSIMVGRDTFSW